MDDKLWGTYGQAAAGMQHAFSVRTSVFDAGDLVSPELENFLDPTEGFEDPNATRLRPNDPTRSQASHGEYWENYGPAIRLYTSFDPGPPPPPPPSPYRVPQVDIDPEDIPPPSSYGASSSYPDALPFTIQWELTLSAPADHVYLTVSRYGGETFVRYAEVAVGAQFPTQTTIDPRWDPDAPTDLSYPTYVTYVIHATAVDVMGRTSNRTCRQVNLRFGWYGVTDPLLAAPAEPSSPIACHPESMDGIGDYFDNLPPNTIEIRRVDHNGNPYTYFRPKRLSVNDPAGSVTLINNDIDPHGFSSLYTWPYPAGLLDTQPIGGVDAMTFGTVAGGDSVTVPLPSGATHRYHWQFLEHGDPRRHRSFKIVVWSP
jgi:hypothetical protein